MKFSYALCNVLSHILLSHMKDKTIKDSFSLFCFLTWIRWISRKKNVRFLVSMHCNWETKLLAGGRHHEGWQMVKSETRRDAEILIRNPSPRLFGETFRDSQKVKTNHEKTRLRDLSETLPRFRDPAKIFRDPRFSRYHSPPLSCTCHEQRR